jgi:hypothetical protein
VAHGLRPLAPMARGMSLAADSADAPTLTMMSPTHSPDRSGTVGLRHFGEQGQALEKGPGPIKPRSDVLF